MTDLCQEAHSAAVAKGFYGDDGKAPRNLGELLMLITSELAEALEADRDDSWVQDGVAAWYLERGKWDDPKIQRAFEMEIKDTVPDEIADAVIRIADLCGYLGIDLESHVRAKMAYNATRPSRHSKRY
jgi:NTP pyrophosphatase (non-canonical NTP hydrolase)